MDDIGLPPSFLTDRALDPLKKLSGMVGPKTLRSYVFFLKRGNFWGSDGLNHVPLNPALMGYFDGLCHAALNRVGRGSLIFILDESANCRYGIVTDNHTLRASLLEFNEAILQTAAHNFHVHAPDVP